MNDNRPRDDDDNREPLHGQHGTDRSDSEDKAATGHVAAQGPIPLLDDNDNDADTSEDAELTPTVVPAPTPAPEEQDRAARAGYPPDSGPEQKVLRVRPSFFRARPLPILAFVVVPPLVALSAWWLGGDENGATWAMWSGGTLGVAAALYIAGWWFVVTRSRCLEITNKRTTEVHGLFSKSTDEVLHDHVRNVTVDQTFYERIARIGKLGIASSGHAGTEIEMQHLPRPEKIREIIDLYRPVG